jgi:hypothetical protein
VSSYGRRRPIRTPDQEAKRRQAKALRRAQGTGGTRGVPAQMDHASNAAARKKAAEGEQKMKRERGDG